MTAEQVQSLKQLKELKDQGVLSQEEFEKEKTSILDKAKASQQRLTESYEEPKGHPSSESKDKNVTKPQKEVVPEKKSWWRENWWMIVVPFAIALAKIISRL